MRSNFHRFLLAIQRKKAGATRYLYDLTGHTLARRALASNESNCSTVVDANRNDQRHHTGVWKPDAFRLPIIPTQDLTAIQSSAAEISV
jgi:hypothetical protein